MFIGHLPAGYLATTALLRRHRLSPTRHRRLLWLGLAASVAPDLDLLYFYLLSDRRTVHHAYWPHLPLACGALLVTVAVVLVLARAGRTAWLALTVVAANVLLHLALDTTAGGIRWLWPWSERELALSHVPAVHQPWYLNFVLHWTFALELALVAWAGRRLWREQARPAPVR